LSEGWITIHRKIVDWEWFSKGNTFHVFMFLLLKANHKPNRWQGVDIKRGQLITGRDKIASKLNISVQSVRTSLARLKTTGEITVESTNKNSLVTIVNYEEYQIKPEAVTSKPTSNATNQQPTNNQQSTTNNNENNNKNEKKETKKGFVLPDWIDKDAWDAWVDMRRRAKKSPTERAKVLAVKELLALKEAGQDVVKVIDMAVYKGWTSFYALKGTGAEKVDYTALLRKRKKQQQTELQK